MLKTTVKIHYGLGNQLFQYALAKSLHISNKKSVFLDTSFYATERSLINPRNFQLDQFQINLLTITDDRINNKSISLRKKIFNKINNYCRPYFKQSIVFEKYIDYDENIKFIKQGAYLLGYWQDERYFQSIESELRNDLKFSIKPIGKNLFFLDLISKQNDSVCIHIRRGDYITDDFVKNNLEICSLEYYYEAIKLIKEKISNPLFYVFSDEPDWVRDNFKPSIVYNLIDHNSEADATEDLRLMSACKHTIISNSSFSWWAAWLNNYNGKIIIAPKVWRKNNRDMYTPKSWIRI